MNSTTTKYQQYKSDSQKLHKILDAMFSDTRIDTIENLPNHPRYISVTISGQDKTFRINRYETSKA